MPGDGPLEAIVGLVGVALVVSLVAQPLNEVTAVNLMMWSQLLWGVVIIGVIAIVYAAVRGLAVGGGR